jgi:hypothetical protein
MEELTHRAGYFAAHGIWCVSEGETLIPIMVTTHADGTGDISRLMYDDVADAARAGQEALATGNQDWVEALLVVDGYIHLDDGKTDALIIEAIDYGVPRQSLMIAVPYRPQQSPEGFAVHRPKIMEVNSFTDVDYDELSDAFFNGIESHEEAGPFWYAHQDTSR